MLEATALGATAAALVAVVTARPASAVGASVGASAEAILGAQPEPVRQQLLRDGLIILQEVRQSGALSGSVITALVIFDRSPDAVYRLLSQTDRQTEYRPGVDVTTVERRPDGPVDEDHLRILFRSYVYRLVYHLDPAAHRIRWTLDDRFANDLERADGAWELFPMAGGRTLGRSSTIVDVGSGVPDFLQDWITRKNLPDTMRRVQRWVDSGGRARP